MSQLALSQPRLAPIERPRGLLLRVGYWLSRRKLGKVMAPLKVIYARMPRLMRPQYAMLRLAEGGLSLTPRLRQLVELRVSILNGCDFCADLHRAMMIGDGFTAESLAALSGPAADGGGLDPAERAALAYVEAMIADRHHIPDAVFAGLRERFDERQIVELTWLCAFVSYLNTMAGALAIPSDGLCALPTRAGDAAAAPGRARVS